MVEEKEKMEKKWAVIVNVKGGNFVDLKENTPLFCEVARDVRFVFFGFSDLFGFEGSSLLIFFF